MFQHESVLKTELVNSINVKPNGTYIDCTLGGAGHAKEIANQLNDDGMLIGFDQDKIALTEAKRNLKDTPGQKLLIHANFSQLKEKLLENNINHVDGIIYDLGVSSPQLDDGSRGFSYRYDSKLDMRMDQTSELSAYEIINNWPYEDLVRIMFMYGEEKFAKQIARKIEAARQVKKIETTFELVDLIKAGIPAAARRTGGHPAKRTFQAIRIAVNDELNAFNKSLHQAAEVISIDGRIAVITFHSLEDRICKQAFKKWTTQKPVPRGMPIIPDGFEAPFKLITRKPILPTEAEVSENKRSRSAMLRIVEKKHQWDDSFTYDEGWRK